MKKLLLLLFLLIFFSCNKKNQTRSDNIKINKKNIPLIEKIEDTTATILNKQIYGKETLTKYLSSAQDKQKNGNFKGAISDYYLLKNMVSNSVLDDSSKFEMEGLINQWIGDCKYELKDYIGAIRFYNLVIMLFTEKDTIFQAAIFKRAMSYYFQDVDYLYFKAIEDFTSAIELQQFTMLSEAYFWRGSAKYKVYDRDGACEDFKKSEDLGSYIPPYIISICKD